MVDFARISIFTFCMLFILMYFMYIMYILCFVPYALKLPVSGLVFMSIKICSVLLNIAHG